MKRLPLDAAIALFAVSRTIPPLTRRDLGGLALIGFMFFGHWLTFFLSIKTSAASMAAVGLSTYGIFLILFGGSSVITACARSRSPR